MELSPRFPFVIRGQGFESFPSDQPRVRWRDLVCVECFEIKPMVDGFYSIGSLMLPWVIGVGSGYTFIVSGK